MTSATGSQSCATQTKGIEMSNPDLKAALVHIGALLSTGQVGGLGPFLSTGSQPRDLLGNSIGKVLHTTLLLRQPGPLPTYILL